MKNNENNNRVNFGIDTNGYTFIALKELPLNAIIRVNGLFIYKGKYGYTPVIINQKDELLITLPLHRFKKVSEILNNNEMVEKIKNNEIIIIVDDYEKDGNHYKTVRFKSVKYLKMEELQKNKATLNEYENIIKIAKEMKTEKAKTQTATTEQNTENTEDLPF